MRFKMFFELENNQISREYKKSIISYIKYSIQNYDENLYQEIYQGNNKKSFTFGVILPEPQFTEDRVILKSNQFSIIFSAYNYLCSLHVYNAFLRTKT